uniref:Uncharacterized protein n=1 Tax=Anguilla anguilla TaxID=7936 RepID=A0A0E9S7C0_ANGAN
MYILSDLIKLAYNNSYGFKKSLRRQELFVFITYQQLNVTPFYIFIHRSFLNNTSKKSV